MGKGIEKGQTSNCNQSNTPLQYEGKDSPTSLTEQPTYEFSVYKAPVSNVIPLKNTTLSKVYAVIISDSYKAVTSHVGALKDKQEQTACKINKLDYVTFSGEFETRSVAGLIKHSSLFCVDLDDLEDTKAIKSKVIDLLPPSLMFVSPSGNGLKIVYKIDINDAEHLQYYNAFEVFFNEQLSLAIDDKCKDVPRACFLCHDSEAYFNEDAEVIDKSFIDTFYLPKQESTPESITETITDLDTIIDNLKTWINKTDSFESGNRNGYISKLASAYNRYGVPISIAEGDLLPYAQSDFTESEITATIRSIYKNNAYHNISQFKVNKTSSVRVKRKVSTPLPWDEIIKTLPSLSETELKSVRSKDFAIVTLINEIKHQFYENHINFNFFNKYYVYQDNFWNEISREKMDIFLRDCTKKYYRNEIKYHTKNFYKPLEESFREDLKVLVEDNDETILLNCNNLTLEFNSNGVVERDARKEDYLTYKLKYDFDIDAKSPIWEKFLDEMLPNKDHQLLLHQYIGYSFTQYLKLEKVLFLYGKGGNGKSVVQDVITKLLGKENTSNVSIGPLTQDRNERLLIEHKLLNNCSENDRNFNLSNFRTLVSGEPIVVEAKYVDKRMMTRYAKLMFNINSIPKINEEKESYLRRLMILVFDKKPKVKDSELYQKIVETELAGILNRVIAALKILLRDKSFVQIPGVSEFSYLETNKDGVQDFIDEIGSAPDPIKASELYNSYVSYCLKNEVPQLSMNSFCKDLIKKGYEPIKRNDGNYYDISVEGGR